MPIISKLYAYGHLGTSSWGGRYSAGLMFYPNESGYGTAISVGYSQATGIANFVVDLEVEPNSYEQEVTLDLESVRTLNLVYYYNIRSGRKNKLTLSAGYAISLSNNNYEVESGEVLNDVSESFIRIMEPGGVVFGVRYVFAL